MDYRDELNAARAAAREAGRLAMEYRSRGVSPESKSDDSPVTIADKESEKLIASMLGHLFPDDGVLGEEGASGAGSSGRKWIIDPIDGTRDFVRGNPLWCNLIGLEDRGEVVVGVAHFPALGRTYWATKSGGAFRDGERLAPSSKTTFGESVLLINGCANIQGSLLGERLGGDLASHFAKFWAVRSLGGSLDACMVASGEAEVWLEPKVAAWDLAPHKLILEESGARFLNLDGGSSIYGGNSVGCAPGVEQAVRDWLKIGS
ncbi:MAG: inositol monophosphatase [Bryobacteraceae bacterium]|nr:inositol monophosphatase [Bryobacteraceae bacterium]